MLAGEVYTIDIPEISAKENSPGVTEALKVTNISDDETYFLTRSTTD